MSNQFLSSKAHSPANGFHEIMQITDAFKKNAHDLNEQTIQVVLLHLIYLGKQRASLDTLGLPYVLAFQMQNSFFLQVFDDN